MLRRIMVVDDEEDILFSLRKMLEKKGFDVICVNNGKSCIKELEKGFCGIILLDIMMPTFDGWDTVNEIVKRGLIQNVKIDIITGKGTRDHQKLLGLETYIHDYLSKPLDPKKLLMSLDECFSDLSRQTSYLLTL